MTQMRILSHLVFLIIAVNRSITVYASLNTQVCHIASFFVDYLIEDKKVEVQFFNYTREHSNVTSLQFDPNKRTTIIVHGFLSTHKADWVSTLTQKLLELEDMVVIAVDWSNVFLKDSLLYYKGAARKSTFVAEQIYNFVLKWARHKSGCKIIWPHLHLIGHSLGAHIVGEVARKLKPHVNVNRVTGLDPAKPYFDGAGANLRLDKTCAQFVDVIHTNSDPNAHTFGIYEPLGHIDFYPNGGDRQCRCSSMSIPISIPTKDSEFVKCFSDLFLGMDLSKLYDNILSRFEQGNNMICDHTVSPDYFADSILSEKPFFAYKVDFPINKRKNACVGYKSRSKGTRIEMGMNAYLYNDSRYHGTYYVDVSCNTPMKEKRKYFF